MVVLFFRFTMNWWSQFSAIKEKGYSICVLCLQFNPKKTGINCTCVPYSAQTHCHGDTLNCPSNEKEEMSCPAAVCRQWLCCWSDQFQINIVSHYHLDCLFWLSLALPFKINSFLPTNACVDFDGYHGNRYVFDYPILRLGFHSAKKSQTTQSTLGANLCYRLIETAVFDDFLFCEFKNCRTIFCCLKPWTAGALELFLISISMSCLCF